jgi:hypothetical protein
MIWIGIRVSIIVLLTIGVVRSSVWIYHTIYDLLDFQITLYRYLLSTQESISNIKTTASWSWNSFMQSIWVWSEGKAELLTQNSISVNQQLATFTNKIELISALISGVIGLLLWKLLFDSIFGIKSLISRIVSFIHEPVEKKSMWAPM